MATALQIKGELIRLQDTYVPAGETAGHISDISIGMIIGATCVGKSTVIRAVTEADPEFSNPGGFTTRQLRAADAKTYRQLDNSPESLAGFLKRVKTGEPVQYNVYDTGHIYGSEVQDYPTPYSVLDTQYKAVDNLRRAGFKAAVPIGVVAHPDQYVYQLRERFGPKLDSDDVQIRLSEAADSLKWLLDQDGVAAIPKASRRESQQSNLGALDIKLDDADRKAIAALPKDQRFVKPGFSPVWD